MVKITGLRGVPIISKVCDLPQILIKTIKKEHFQIAGGDIICVASKICSLAKGDVVDLKQVVPTSLARKIQQRISRKDERLIQVIIYQTSDPTRNCCSFSNEKAGC